LSDLNGLLTQRKKVDFGFASAIAVIGNLFPEGA
jgi:hypothetical protein